MLSKKLYYQVMCILHQCTVENYVYIKKITFISYSRQHKLTYIFISICISILKYNEPPSYV